MRARVASSFKIRAWARHVLTPWMSARRLDLKAPRANTEMAWRLSLSESDSISTRARHAIKTAPSPLRRCLAPHRINARANETMATLRAVNRRAVKAHLLYALLTAPAFHLRATLTKIPMAR